MSSGLRVGIGLGFVLLVHLTCYGWVSCEDAAFSGNHFGSIGKLHIPRMLRIEVVLLGTGVLCLKMYIRSLDTGQS